MVKVGGRRSRLELMRKLFGGGEVRITIFKLMAVFGVGEVTIRRDIEYLNAKYPFEVPPSVPRR